jgi:hypothetical protein
MPGMQSLSIATAIEIAQQCTCFNLRKATRAITLMYDRVLRPSGLRTAQFSQRKVAQHFGKNQLNHFLSELSKLTVTLNIKSG